MPLFLPVLSLNYQYLIGVVLGCFVVRHAIRLVYHAATARRRKGFAYSSVEGESAENDSAEGRYRIVELAQRVDGWLQESPSLSGWRRVELLFTAGIIAINVLFSFVRPLTALRLALLIDYDPLRSSQRNIRRCNRSRQTGFASTRSGSAV